MATVFWDPGNTKTLTIALGATLSDVLDLQQYDRRNVWTITIINPATLPETVTVQVADRPDGTFAAFQPAGADATLPAAKATLLATVNARALRLVAGGAVAATRTFVLQGNLRA